MRTFAWKQNSAEQARPESAVTHDRAWSSQSRAARSILHLQRTIGNRAVQRMLQADNEKFEAGSSAGAASGLVHDFSQIPKFNTSPVQVQPKLTVSAPKNKYEQEADLIADQVMRMPEPIAGEDEKQKLEFQAKTLPQAGKGEFEINGDLENRIGGERGGNPVSEEVRAFVETRMQFDFSKVRIHTDTEAAQMNRDLSARAFTHGKDIYFGAGQYNPGSHDGKRLLVHELSHVVQQRKTPSIQRAPLTISGRQFMEGDVVLNRAASRDIRTHGNLLPGADQGHIAVTSNGKLAYEISYTAPEDPFRWNSLKNIIDNHHVQIFAVGNTDSFDSKVITINHGIRREMINPVNLLMFMASGITMPTEAQQLRINPTATTIVASTSSTYHQVYYETGRGGRGMLGSNSLAHELFGHLWLALQGVQFKHGGSLAGTTNITDPLGRQFTGSVNDYIDKFAGASSTSVIESPTYNVSPQYLLSAIQWMEQNGATHISTQGNGRIDADLDLKWQALSNNYDILMINPQTGAAVSQNLTLTAANVVTRMVTWINGLPPDKKTAFKNVLRAITQSFSANRRTGLSSAVFPLI